MTDFDLIVIGGGAANNVAATGADAGLETALIEPGPLGGTCLNRGCNPSKMLIQAANAANDVRRAEKFHVEASLGSIDHASIVDDMDDLLGGVAAGMEDRYREKDNLALFKEYTRFLDDRTVELDGEAVTGEKVVIATGSRPLVPPIDGLDEIDYLTSREALYRRELPERLVILGGGYIAVELGYYFQSVGSDVAIIEMEETLVPNEDAEIAAEFTEVAAARHDVRTDHRVTAIERAGGEYEVHATSAAGDAITVAGDAVLVALGRRPNSDTLNLEATDVSVDDRGFIENNEYLETTAPNVWTQGDVAGNAMFKHSADYETQHTIANAIHGERKAVDFSAMPHVIFTEPQIAGVGPTEEELRADDREYVVGRSTFPGSSMGRAKKLEHGTFKVLASPTGEIFGAHAFGYEASTLMHEVVLAKRTGVTVPEVADTIHAHPSLSKIVAAAFQDVPVKAPARVET